MKPLWSVEVILRQKSCSIAVSDLNTGRAAVKKRAVYAEVQPEIEKLMEKVLHDA